MTRPIRAWLDRSALVHNHDVVRNHVSEAKVWSIVKANAYGHGLIPTANALKPHTDGFALVELDGALALREAGIRLPILMLEGPYAADEWYQFAELELTPVVHTMWQIDTLIKAHLPEPIPVYIKLNTGMNRLGFNADEFKLVLSKLANHAGEISLLTHFADADEARGIDDQLARFRAMVSDHVLPVSLANSAALLRFPESVGDWVRPGIMLYGASPFPAVRSAQDLGLRQVMTLESELIAVRDLSKGDAVGYGSSFVAEHAMRIGIVACGYADGYPRHAPTGTPVVVAGQRTRTLGRVSMDKLCVDLTELPTAVGIGDKVTLWGGEGDDYLAADDVASAAGTVAYELFCSIANRVTQIEIEIES